MAAGHSFREAGERGAKGPVLERENDKIIARFQHDPVAADIRPWQGIVMARPDMTLSVVGGIHPNADGSNRLFEIALCAPGEAVQLVPELKNKHDPSAVAVFSARGIQIGYLSAERCGWIGSKIRLGEELRAAFQAQAKGGALIRVSFNGEDPILPDPRASQPRPAARPADWDDDFYPDEIWPDDV